MTEAHLARPPPEFAPVKGLSTAGYERSRRRDSNPQPPVYKTGALPVAPRRHGESHSVLTE